MASSCFAESLLPAQPPGKRLRNFARTCYSLGMTKLLDEAVAAVHSLPPNEQDRIADAMLRLAGRDDEPVLDLSAQECMVIAESRSAAARGEFATDEEIRRVWAKHEL